MLSEMAEAGGASWVSLLPNSLEPVAKRSVVQEQLIALGGTRYEERVVMVARNGVTLIIDSCGDGRERIARVAKQLRQIDDFTEHQLSATLCAPAPQEPDLVIVLGDPTRMPQAVVWELAYAEIVFLDSPWFALNAEHLEMAIDDFTRRDRRFGGLDS